MTITYLSKIVSGVADSLGNVSVILRPDVGQFWAPSIVRVTTRLTPQNNPNETNASYCAIFHGSVGAITGFIVNIDSSAFLDDTYLGSGDSSSVVAGSVIIPGEGIAATWTDVTPGDTVVLSLSGRSGNDLQELQSVLSPIPGAKFSGNVGNAMLWEYANEAQPGPAAFPWTFVTPDNAVIELIGVQYNAITTAAGTARGFGVMADFGGLHLFTSFPNGGQPASSTLIYNFSQGQPVYALVNRVGGSIPSKMILPPSTIVRSAQAGPVVGDTWSQLNIAYRRYSSLSKVSFT